MLDLGTSGRVRPALAGRQAAEACNPSMFGDDKASIVSIYAVVDGKFDGLCYGPPDTHLIAAWLSLASMTTASDRLHVTALAAFHESGDTVAFTKRVDILLDFGLAFDTAYLADSPSTIGLIVAHEWAHVRSQAADQDDILGFLIGCRGGYATDSNCFRPESYMSRWVDEFWREDELEQQRHEGADDRDGAARRCAADARYLGEYAASSPEEDFAESFSAFVFDVPVPDAVKPKLAFFERFPELVAHRDLRRASGLPDAPNTFDRCG